MDLGKLGVWYFFDGVTTDVATEAAQRIESLGYGTLWLPETVGKDPLTTASWFLANTKTLNMATGIVNIYNREPGVMLAAQRTLAEQSGGRFALAMGVSHKPLVEGVRGLEYGPPVATMRNYLEKMSASIYNGPAPAETPPTLIAALGPKMLELAKEQTDGAHPYFTSPDHTAMARGDSWRRTYTGGRAKDHFGNRCDESPRTGKTRRKNLSAITELSEQLAAHGIDRTGHRRPQRSLYRCNLCVGQCRRHQSADTTTYRCGRRPRLRSTSKSEWTVWRFALGMFRDVAS